jgi:hypothetical protein
MTRRVPVPRDTGQIWRCARLLLALLAVASPIALSWKTGNASSASQPLGPSTSQASSSAPKTKLPTVTIEAKAQLKRQVDHFVTSEVFQPPGESLMRWNTPICPLVQGLPPEFNEFIQARIRRIARSAGVPVAGKQCTANLYVFATDHPELLLNRLLAHNPQMFNTQDGLGGVARFLHSRRPVRVWYNAELHCRSARGVSASMHLQSMGSSMSTAGGPGGYVNGTSSSFCAGGGTRLSYSNVDSISSST